MSNENSKKIKVGNKHITIRKWKGKDKKLFKEEILKENINFKDVLNTLVYNCIEEDVVLSADEFRYVLIKIREFSLGSEFEFEFYCEECDETFNKKLTIDEIIRYTYEDVKEIKVNDITLKLGNIKNKDIYLEKISGEDGEMHDFLLRVEKINDNDSFTYNELIDFFDELDIQTIEEIIEIWNNSKFTLDDINEVECKCGKCTKYKFDELPGFLPESWY